MRNMSNQFYDYLSNKLFEYFYENNLKIGDKFYIDFDEEDEVISLYESLKNNGKNKYIFEEFCYKHDYSNKEYKTFSLNINGIKLVVVESVSINIDYIVTLRNQVTEQKGVWKDTALLVICHKSIDSIYNGMRNLQKEDMPLNINSISKNLEKDLIKSQLDKKDQEIIKFSLKNQDDYFTTTLFDYENILSIINKGSISEDDFKKLELFRDDNLSGYSSRDIKNRLEENHSYFMEINKISQYGDKKEQLEEITTKKGIKLLNKDDWYTNSWKTIKKEKDLLNESKGLEYYEPSEKITENGLSYWEKPNSHTKAGRRTRNIIVFNNKELNEVSFRFKFDKRTSNQYLNKKSKKITESSGNALKVRFNVFKDKPTFKSVNYSHNNETKSTYKFNIVVLNAVPEIFETIKSRYQIKSSHEKIVVINDEDSSNIVFGKRDNNIINEISVEENGDKYSLYDNESLLISENSPAWERGILNFTLMYNENEIAFEIKEKSNRAIPVKSHVIWNEKRKNRENFVFNGVKAVQDINSYYLEDSFKDILKLEHYIIENNVFYGKIDINNEITKEEVHYSEDLEAAYIAILDYYRNYDDSPEDNLPSLMYLNSDLKELYQKFINVFNREIEEIEENSVLSDYPNKKDLIKLGRLDKDNEIFYTSLSPVNIAYQLELSNQCGTEELDNNMIERLVPNNIIPYVILDNDELYRPIYQEVAHEWLCYKKSENVSIGTTNVFISNLVYEKLTQFVKHYEYLFDINPNSPIRINLININDDKEVVRGVFKFIRSRLPDKTKTKNIVPVEINVYNNSYKSNFDKLFECNSKEEIFEEFGSKNISLKSDVLDEIDIIHLVQDNITYYKHSLNKSSLNDIYEYAHICFYKCRTHNGIANEQMENIETGLSLNGLLSSVTSTTVHNEYRTGFGTKYLENKDNTLVKTAISLNELMENSRNKGKNTYSKNKSSVTTVELEEDNIQKLYDCSHWVTFIEPTFGLEYFNDDDNLIIIHYSDQYSSSSKYDTITVTNKTIQYEDIIKDFLKDKNIEVSDEDVVPIIKMFNCVNGEWLLRIISSNGEDDREKLSIISAIKYGLSILNHENIYWIPVSMEEILRIAGNVKLDKSKGIFSSSLKKGVYSDDLLFIGLKVNNKDKLDVIFYPIEVKVGLNKTGTIKKGKKQLHKTYDLLKEQLFRKNDEENEFKNKFFRNFFMQIFLSNEKKFTINKIWSEKNLEVIEKFKDKLLNDDFNISNELEEYIGIGSLISFKNNYSYIRVYRDTDNIQIIELPEDRAYSGLLKPIQDIFNEIHFDRTDIHASDLLYSIDLNKPLVNVVEETIEKNSYELTDEPSMNYDENNINSINLVNETTEQDIQVIDKKIQNIENHTAVPIKVQSLNDIRVLLGTEENTSNHKIYWEYGNKNLPNRHLLIQGKSGQGKTYFIQRILNEVSHSGIPTIIIDYTDGFKKSQLEKDFKRSLGDKLKMIFLIKDKFDLNPFKKHNIELDEGIFMLEDNQSVAGRFKSVINSVYQLGIQQSNCVYEAALRGLNKSEDEMDLSIFREELEKDQSNPAISTLNKLRELLDKNPFVSSDFDWSDILDNDEGTVLVIQLTGLSKDVQKTITEFILWDLWNYKASTGSEDKPFNVILDEAQNLDFSEGQPCSKILTEGRKFGWSGWFATQSLKGMSSEEISKFDNAAMKIYFHPTDNSISEDARNISKSNKKIWESKLSKLNKGDCVVNGSLMSSNNRLLTQAKIIHVDSINDYSIKKFEE